MAVTLICSSSGVNVLTINVLHDYFVSNMLISSEMVENISLFISFIISSVFNLPHQGARIQEAFQTTV